MLVSEKLATAAHVHVMLRRKTGRVTDTEWMAANVEYALEIVRFARAKAQEDGHPDLAEWADKLERVMLDTAKAPHKPLAQTAMQLLRERSVAATAPAPLLPEPAEPPAPTGFVNSIFGDSGFLDSAFGTPKPKREPEPPAPRYVGGIR